MRQAEAPEVALKRIEPWRYGRDLTVKAAINA